MKPELVNDWNEALRACKKAECHLNAGEHKKAEEEAWRAAAVLGYGVMKTLLTADELERIGLYVHLEGVLKVSRKTFPLSDNH
jgi:hypothetical protein